MNTEPYSGPEPELVGKPVTIFYEIVNPEEFRKYNPLKGDIVHGMRPVGMSARNLWDVWVAAEDMARLIEQFNQDSDIKRALQKYRKASE